MPSAPQISPGKQQEVPQQEEPAWQKRPSPQQAAPGGAQLPSAQVTGHVPVHAGFAAAGPTHWPSTQASPERQQVPSPQQVPLSQMRPSPQQLPPSGAQAPSAQGIGRRGSAQVAFAPGTQRPATHASNAVQQAPPPQHVPLLQKRPSPQQLAPAGAHVPSAQATGQAPPHCAAFSQPPAGLQASPAGQ